MKKSHRIILNIISVICIQILTFFCNYYPMHIIERFPKSAIVEIVFNIFVFVIHSIFLILVFYKNSSFFSDFSFKAQDKACKRRICLKFSYLLMFQLAYDVFLLLSKNLQFEMSYFVFDISSVIYWVIVYLIVANNKLSLFKKRRSLMAFVGVATAVLLVGFLWNINQINYYSGISQKYLVDSPYVLRERLNLDFIYSIKSVIVCSVLEISLLLIHASGIGGINQQDEELYKNSEISKLFIRIYLIFLICDLILGAKILISPTTTSVARGDVNITDNLPLYSRQIKQNQKLLFRGFETSQEDKIPVYALLNVEINVGGEQIYFTLNPEIKESLLILGDFKKDIHNCSIAHVIDETEVFVYFNYAISFLDDGVPRLITLTSLDDMANDPIIVKLLEKLISDGYVFAFEYGCNYLLQHDPDFIIPYIVRYCAGDFSENEMEWMEKSYYRSDYIIDFAKQIHFD